MRDYPQVYAQRDPRWAGHLLGEGPATIGPEGCYLTSFAMKACYYGHSVDPVSLNDKFVGPDGVPSLFADSDEMVDNNLARAYPDLSVAAIYDYSNTPADVNLLNSLLQDPAITVTLELDFDHDPDDGIQTHFVECKDVVSGMPRLYDPWYGQLVNFQDHYGSNPSQTILKFVVYRGTPTTATPQNSSGNYYKGYDLANPDSMKVAVDVLVRLQDGELVNKSDLDAANAKLTTFQGQLSSQVDQLNSLRNDLTLAQNADTIDKAKITDLMDQLSKVEASMAQTSNSIDPVPATPTQDVVPVVEQNTISSVPDTTTTTNFSVGLANLLSKIATTLFGFLIHTKTTSGSNAKS